MYVKHSAGLVAFEIADDSALALALQRRTLEAAFAATLGQYPQYAGWAAGATLVRVPRRIRTKGGLAFEAGDLALAVWDEGWPEADLEPHWTCFSTLRGGNVAVADAEPVA